MDCGPPWLGAAILAGVVSTPVGVKDAAEVLDRARLRTAVDEHGAGFVDVADDQVQTAEGCRLAFRATGYRVGVRYLKFEQSMPGIRVRWRGLSSPRPARGTWDYGRSSK